MTWIDIVIILIFVGVLIAEMVRGFFPALLWMVMEYFVLLMAQNSYRGASDSLRFFEGTVNDGFWYGLIFVALSALAFWLSHYLSTVADVDIGAFEQLIGMILGIGTSFIIAHAFTRMLDIGSVNGPVHQAIAGSSIANELLNFSTWHKWTGRLIEWSQTAKY